MINLHGYCMISDVADFEVKTYRTKHVSNELLTKINQFMQKYTNNYSKLVPYHKFLRGELG